MLYKPSMYKKNIKEINYSKLKEQGIKCLLFDLDNTIVNYYNPIVDKETINFFKDLKKDFIIYIFSNSPKKRVLKINKYLNLNVVSFALKPLSFNFKKVIKKHNLKNDEVVIIGDQLMTDIKGGNTAKIMTILVDPIEEKELTITKFNRILEKYQLNKLSKSNQLKRGKYYE